MSEGITKSQISEAIFGWGLRNDDGHNLSMDDTDEIAEYIMKQAAQARAVNQQLVGAPDLREELGIMIDIVKEICHERSVSLPAYSIKRAEKALAAAQEQPQPAVNQQLLEALKDLLAYVEQGLGDTESDEGLKAHVAIAAAQEQKV